MKSRTGYGLLRVICFLVIFLFSSAGGVFLSAQTYQGRILGTITDASGAVLAGAKVTVTNSATGVSRNLVSTSSGEHIAPDLDPGPYRAPVEAAGFKKAESTPVVLAVGRDLSINMRLLPGAGSGTMEGSAPE